MQKNFCYLRILNSSPNSPALDIYINNQIFASNLNYKNFSDYIKLNSQNFFCQIFLSSNQNNKKLLLAKNLSLYPQKIYTLAIIGEYNSNSFNLNLIDDHPRLINKNFSYTRFINLSPTAQEINISLDNQLILSSLSYTTYSNYFTLPAKTYNLKIYLEDLYQDQLILQNPKFQLNPNKIYSTYIIGLYTKNSNQTQILIPLEGATYLKF